MRKRTTHKNLLSGNLKTYSRKPLNKVKILRGCLPEDVLRSEEGESHPKTMNSQDWSMEETKEDDSPGETPQLDLFEIPKRSAKYVNPVSELSEDRKRKTNSNIKDKNENLNLDASLRYKVKINNKYELLRSLPSDGETAVQESKPPKPRIPPIFLCEVNNYKEIISDLKNLTSSDFLAKQNNENIKIQLTSPDDYRKVTKYYTECGIKYFTFVNPEEAAHKLSVIIKPIPVSLSDEEVKEMLVESYPVHSVTRLYGRNKQPTAVVAVLLTNDEKGKTIFDLDRFFHCVVRVEPRRRSRQIPQCTNCLRYNHTRNYCHLDPRCLRCAGDHLFRDCPYRGMPPGPQAPKLKCSNCQKEHVASYRGCEAHKKLKEQIRYRYQRHTQFQPAPPPSNNAWDKPLYPPQQQDGPAASTPQQPHFIPIVPNNPADFSGMISDLLKKLIEPFFSKIQDFLRSLITSVLKSFNGP